MAASSWDQNQPRFIDGPRDIIYGSAEANSQTFKAGCIVYSNAGAITIGAVGDVPFLGIAMKDATNVTSANIDIPIMVIDGKNKMIFQVENNASGKEASDTTCVAGTAYDFNVDGDLVFTIDSSDTTNPKFIFLEPVLDEHGDSTYWGVFKPLNTETQAEME